MRAVIHNIHWRVAHIRFLAPANVTYIIRSLPYILYIHSFTVVPRESIQGQPDDVRQWRRTMIMRMRRKKKQIMWDKVMNTDEFSAGIYIYIYFQLKANVFHLLSIGKFHINHRYLRTAMESCVSLRSPFDAMKKIYIQSINCVCVDSKGFTPPIFWFRFSYSWLIFLVCVFIDGNSGHVYCARSIHSRA